MHLPSPDYNDAFSNLNQPLALETLCFLMLHWLGMESRYSRSSNRVCGSRFEVRGFRVSPSPSPSPSLAVRHPFLSVRPDIGCVCAFNPYLIDLFRFLISGFLTCLSLGDPVASIFLNFPGSSNMTLLTRGNDRSAYTNKQNKTKPCPMGIVACDRTRLRRGSAKFESQFQRFEAR